MTPRVRTFWIPGPPTAKGRCRGSGRRRYTPIKTVVAEAHIRAAYMASYAGEPMLQGPLRIRMVIIRPRPQKHYRVKGGEVSTMLKEGAPGWAPVRPDVSNILKAVEDALNGVAYRDDNQLVYYESMVSAYQQGRDILPEYLWEKPPGIEVMLGEI